MARTTEKWNPYPELEGKPICGPGCRQHTPLTGDHALLERGYPSVIPRKPLRLDEPAEGVGHPAKGNDQDRADNVAVPGESAVPKPAEERNDEPPVAETGGGR
jgi:hypothetical protein